jgi:hypothetical protein
VLQTALESGPAVKLMFSATPGLSYQLQYKAAVQDAAWQVLGTELTAASNSVSVLDWLTNSVHRIYRVRQGN